MMFLHPSLSVLSKAVDAMLDPRAQVSVKRHLESCGLCRQKFQALGHVKARLQMLPALEENVGHAPETPVFIPSARPTALVVKTLGLGILLGAAITALVALLPGQPALKVISSSSDAISSEGVLNAQGIGQESTIRTPLSTGNVDLEIPNKVLLRLKPGTTVTWQQVNRFQFARPHIIVNVMRGEILARTVDGFWGSKLELRTPSASAFVKGTAFGLKVDPSEDTTTLNVLAGTVFFSPHLGKVGVNVPAGTTSRIRSERLPALPEKLSADQRRAMLEAYRIGKNPLVALVVGAGPERLDELLDPALLFVSMDNHPRLQPFLRKALEEMNSAILAADFSAQAKNLAILEMALEDMTDEEVAVPLRLFAGATAAKMGDPMRSTAHFRRVTAKFPRHPLASLGLAAIGMVAQNQWKDAVLAREYFTKVLAKYPKSPEALTIREHLRENPQLAPSVPTGVAN